MKIPILSGFIERRARARLRRIMRGYRRLNADGDLGRIMALKEALAITPVCSPDTGAMRFLGLDNAQTELSVRQFLLVRRVTTGLSEVLLESLGSQDEPVLYALPAQWRKVLRSCGFPMAEKASSLLWMGFSSLYFANGLLTVFKLALTNAAGLVRRKGKRSERYVFFDALGSGNLPSIDVDDEKNDIVNWYLGWPQRASDIESIRHSVSNIGDRFAGNLPVTPIQSPIIPLYSFDELMKLLLWGAVSACSGLVQLLQGKWWQALMFGEAAKAAQVRFQKPELLACDYLFHNSNWIYRPVWTYEAAHKGSRILFYFYSTNIEYFKVGSCEPPVPYGWRAMSWPHYIVWDEYQASFIGRSVGVAVIDVVNPIPFHAGKPVSKDIPTASVAVFDVQPMRDAIYQPLAPSLEYYVPRNANKFIVDIQEATRLAKRVMVLKRKRNVGARVHPSYERTVNLLSAASNFLEIDADTSAKTLIEKCQMVISMPFTSTALIGCELGKPSIYYDPYGICDKDDRAAHGIPILHGIQELSAWLMDAIGSTHIKVAADQPAHARRLEN